MRMNRRNERKTAVKRLEKEGVSKRVSFGGGKLQLRECGEGEGGEGVMRESADESVEEEGIGDGDEVEGGACGEGAAAEGVRRDKFGDDEGVVVEAKAEDL